jgi:hypothetical protein
VASTLDRRRELGLLRAIGATRAQIGRLFITEAAGLGFVGIVLGVGAGWGLSLLLVHVIQFQSTGWRFIYHFPGWMVAGTCLVTFVAAAQAALPRASRRGAGAAVNSLAPQRATCPPDRSAVQQQGRHAARAGGPAACRCGLPPGEAARLGFPRAPRRFQTSGVSPAIWRGWRTYG